MVSVVEAKNGNEKMPFDSKPAAIAQLQTFTSEHRVALLCAAEFLGGTAGGKRCARLLDEIGTAAGLTRRMRRELEWLHGLLTLENVHDLESEEAALFSLIDPADPRVAEICALADTLRGEIDALPAPKPIGTVTALARCA